MEGTKYETKYERFSGFSALPDGTKLFLSVRNGRGTEEGEGMVRRTPDGKTFILHDFDIGSHKDPNPPPDMGGFEYAYFVACQEDLHGWAFINR